MCTRGIPASNEESCTGKEKEYIYLLDLTLLARFLDRSFSLSRARMRTRDVNVSVRRRVETKVVTVLKRPDLFIREKVFLLSQIFMHQRQATR